MKKKSLWGAIALTAALTLGGAGSAFAAVESDASVGSDGGTDTSVKLATYTSKADPETQVSVTVPLNMTIVANAAGGKAFVPSAGSYIIQNNSMALDVQVQGAYAVQSNNLIKLTMAASPFNGTEQQMTTTEGVALYYKLVGGVADTTQTYTQSSAVEAESAVSWETISANYTEAKETVYPAPSTGYEGDLFLGIWPTADGTSLTEAEGKEGASVWKLTGGAVSDWEIAANGTLPLSFEGSSSKITAALDNVSAAPVVLKLTYTVKAVTNQA